MVKEGPPVKSNLDMTSAICGSCRKAYANKGENMHTALNLRSNMTNS